MVGRRRTPLAHRTRLERPRPRPRLTSLNPKHTRGRLVLSLSGFWGDRARPERAEGAGASTLAVPAPDVRGPLLLPRPGSSNPHASRYPSHLYRSGCLGFAGKSVRAFFGFPRNSTSAGIKYHTSSGIT